MSQAAGGKPAITWCAQCSPFLGALRQVTPGHLREDVHCSVVCNGEILLPAGEDSECPTEWKLHTALYKRTRWHRRRAIRIETSQSHCGKYKKQVSGRYLLMPFIMTFIFVF